MRRLHFVLAAALLVFLGACATVYQSKDFSDYQQQHRTLAILPPSVSINVQSFKAGTEPSLIEAQERSESELFYRQLYAQFLKQFGKDRYSVDFQDIDQTAAILEQAGLTVETLRTKSKSEVAALLGVDAVISTRVYRDKPMSTGAAIFSVLVAGASLANEVQLNVGIHDGKSGRLVWNYDHLIGGGVVSSAEGMAKSLMGSISKKFPYRRNSKSNS